MGLNDDKDLNPGDSDGGGDGGISGGSDCDDDLTNLTWLQDRNLLKSMTVPNVRDNDIERFLTEENENVYPRDLCSSPDGSKDESLPCSVPPVEYNPLVHIHAKPPYSFSSLIFMAIESSPIRALPVKDIYTWIVDHFPYYQNSPSGWKNTVRHNLSLNKCFKKLDKAKDDYVPIVGKGSLWTIDPELRPNLLQALRRTPAHIYPYMSTVKTNHKTSTTNDISSFPERNQTSTKILTLDQLPQITSSPLLGKRLLIPIMNRESEEADAAESMLTLTRYSSDDSNVIIIDDKSETTDQSQDGSTAPVATINPIINPTDDHNYFSQTEAKKKNVEIVTTQDFENLEIEIESDPKEQIELLEDIAMVTDGKKTQTIVVKRKVEDNDDDGLKGAQALLNLATRSCLDSARKSAKEGGSHHNTRASAAKKARKDRD